MTKKVNNIEDEVSQMPEPQTMDYNQVVRLTDDFVVEVHKALDTFAYNEVDSIFKAMDQLKNSMPINIANEIIARIASFPYNRVATFMHNFEENQSKYVVLQQEVNNQ